MRDWLVDAPTILEFVPPPKRLGLEGLEKRLRHLERLLDQHPFSAINLPEIREEESRSALGERTTPYEPRFSAREIALEIRQRFAIPAIVNHVVARQSATDLSHWLRETHDRFQVEDFVLVGPARGNAERIGPSVPEANEILRSVLPGNVTVGNICIPGRRSGGIEEAERMEQKATVGVDFFTTQIVYHSTPCVELLDTIARRCPRAALTPILVSLCPLRRAESIGFLRWLGVELDELTAQRLTRDRDHVLERSIQHLVAVWRKICEGVERAEVVTPLGLNIAPVGPMPASATVRLAQALASPITEL